MKIIKLRNLTGLATLIWMGVIFLFSNDAATDSSKKSELIVRKLQETGLINIAKDLEVFIVRKAAHAFLYLVLAILAYAFVRTYKLPAKRAAGYVLGFCFIYACSDEIHQLFSKGRSAEFRDVLVDLVGSSIGLGLYTLVLVIFSRQRKDSSEGDT